MTGLAHRVSGFGTTIFTEMSALAESTGSINLGQGFPDTDGPPSLLDGVARAIADGHNQYAPLPGVPALRRAIAAHQERFYGMPFDPDTEVQVTFGATEAIAAALLGLAEPGDEVVVFEPFYDCYPAAVALAGGVRRPVTLRPPSFALDEGALRAAVGPRTRFLLLNTPHNPAGKVFTPEELAVVAEVCVEHDLVVLSDEVYEHMAFDRPHVPMASLPGMRERTLTISSAGKTFSVTGWKTGWAVGPAHLVAGVRAAKQFLSFAGGTPFQVAVADALGLPDSVYDELLVAMRSKRDRLSAGLASAGFEVVPSAGTYFVNVLVDGPGVDFCRSLPGRAGVVAIPTGAFYDDPDAGRSLVRFAFCKRDEVLDEAVDRLRAAYA